MVVIVDIVFIGFWLVLAYCVFTQILRPCWNGTPLMPMFKNRLVRKASDEEVIDVMISKGTEDKTIHN